MLKYHIFTFAKHTTLMFFKLMTYSDENQINNFMQKLIFITILCLSPFFLFSQLTPLSINKGNSLIPLTSQAVFKEDKTWKLDFKTIQSDTSFVRMTQDIFKIGGSNARNIWVKFQAQKETTKDIYLDLSTGITDTLYLYAVNPQGEVTTQRIGKYFPYSERQVKHNRQVFLLDGQKGELMTYYLNMRSSYPLSIRMRVGSYDIFAEEYHASDLLHGIFVGIVFIVALFNLFFFVNSRDVFYGCYVGYAVFILFTVLRFDGYLYQYLHPNFPEFNVLGFYFHGLAGVFGIYFSRDFLKTKVYIPQLDKGFAFFLFFYVLNIGLAAVGLYELNILLVYFITLPFNLFLIYAGILVYRSGYQIARFFVAGVFCLTIGITVFTLYNVGWIGNSIWVQNAMYISIALEAIMFFRAIVDRFGILRQEKHDVQLRMIESLQQNESLMRERNRLLEEHAYNRSLELELMQSQLSEYAQKLIKSNQELTDFAHIASHDLRAPIRNIGSFTQLLEKRLASQLDERSKEYLEFVKTNVRQSTKLIEDLLNYSKIDKNIGAPQSVDLSKVLFLVNNNLQSFITEKKAQIIAGDLPMLMGHTSLFVQLFQNFINNGLKYNKQENPTVTISTEWQGNDMVFKIKDNGIGILPQYQDQIFGMFRRLHSSAEYEGSGIGLAFCQRIVATYGGRIWLESEEGKGTTFFFTLPKAMLKETVKEDKLTVPTPQIVLDLPNNTEGANQKGENVFTNNARPKSPTYPTAAQPAFVHLDKPNGTDPRVVSERNTPPNPENAARIASFDMEKIFRKAIENRFSDHKPPSSI
jgi:signal transduction histidine kinase